MASRSLVAKLRGRSVAELRERLAQRLSALAERVAGWEQGEADAAALLHRLLPNVAAIGSTSLATALRERSRPRFVPGLEDPVATAAFVRARWPGRVPEIVRACDDLVAGRFALLGYPAQQHSDPVDWTRDPVAGVRPPDAHWSVIPYLDPSIAGDHKLVWELNRHQFLVTLGQGYLLTGDERYAERAVALLSAWMDANPPKRGVNWASSLEVAYRAIAWTWAFRLLRRSPAFTREVTLRLLAFLDASARHVSRYLSTYFSPNTHLTGEALGLLYVGTQFPELRDAARWASRGWEILLGQIPRHVREDGSYFEQSTYYHRYTLDIYLHARLLGAATDREGIEQVDRAVAGLAHFLAWTSRGDGTIPLFGDEDGGQLLFLDARDPDDVRAPLAVAAVLLGRGELRAVAGQASDDLAWLLGSKGVAAFARLDPTPPDECARAFPAGGFFVMRDGWRPDSAVLTIDCGPLGADNGGHAHADTLAFDLSIGGAPLFVDAGTVSYTVAAAERDAMRSSLVHNTVSLDGRSSSEPAGPFQWQAMTAGVVDVWHAAQGGACFEGHHDGYARPGSAARHRRLVLAARDGWWLLRDVIEGTGEHDAMATFQCAPGLDARVLDDALEVMDDGHLVARVQTLGGSGAWRVEEGVASRRYGAREAALRARHLYRAVARTTTRTYAITRGDPAEWSIAVERSDAGEVVRLRSARHDDLVLFDPQGTVDGVRTDARMAWLRRRPADGVVESLMVVGGTMVELDGAAVARPDGGALSAVRERGEWRVSRAGDPSPAASRRAP